MKIERTKSVCSTRLRRVQFGVPPNCRVARTQAVRSTEIVCRGWQAVSGVTPETTRGTRVLHNFSLRLCVK